MATQDRFTRSPAGPAAGGMPARHGAGHARRTAARGLLAAAALVLTLPELRAQPAPAAPAAVASATAAAPSPDTVLARVDGVAITEADLAIAAEDLASRLPPNASEQQRREYLIGFLIDLKIGARAAETAKLGEAPATARRLSYFRNKVLMDEIMTREAAKAVTPDAARKLYDETAKAVPPEDEVRARHILVEKEDEAKAILARLKAGEDFAKVAGTVSKDPGSGSNGGDLGYFTKDRMVPSFAEAAFKLKPGEISEPVQSQFGWHVIKLEDRRAKAFPPFEEVKGEIDTYLRRKAQQDAILALRGTAKVERLDGAPPAPATPAKP